MVLPSPIADAAPAGEAWLTRLRRLIHLSDGGRLILLEDAGPAVLRPVVRTMIDLDADTRVCLDAGALATLPAASLVLLRLRLAEADWLNLNRPLFARQSLRAVLWGEPGVAAELHARAPDFVDWISHIVVCPELVPAFVIASLRAAPAFPGVVWRGPIDPEKAVAAAFPGTPCQRRAWPRKYTDVLAALREAAPGWLVWDGLPNVRACHRLRIALREVGRADLRCIVLDPPKPALGFWPIDTRQADWETAAATLGNPRLAALSGLEPLTLEGLANLHTPDLDTFLRHTDDPGAALARIAPDVVDPMDLATFRAPPHILRAIAPDLAFASTITTRVEQALVRWYEIAEDPDKPVPTAAWTATPNELVIWSAAPRSPLTVPLAATPIPIPEGAYVLEAAVSPDHAPRDDAALERLVWLLHAFGQFDAALAWSNRGTISEPMRVELRRVTDPDFIPPSPDPQPPINIRLHLSERRVDRLSVGLAVQTSLPNADTDAEKRLEDAWSATCGELVEPQPLFASVCQQTAEPLLARGRPEECIRLLERALRNYIPTCGPEHYSVGYAHGQLSTALFAMGRLEEALQHAREALVIFRDTVGDAHPVTLGQVRQLGSQLLGRQDVEGAWALTRSVVQSALREADSTLAIGETLMFLGTIELASGRVKQAQQHFESALRIATTRAGATSEAAARCHQNLAVALWSRGRMNAALNHMRQTRAIIEHIHGPDSHQTHLIYQNLATLLAENGGLPEAEALLRTALARMRPDDDLRLEIVAHLAKVLTQNGRPEEAEPLIDDALAHALGRPGISPDAIGGLVTNLAALYSRTGRNDAGFELLQRYAPDLAFSPDYAAFTAISLARGFAARGQYARALELAAHGLELEHSAMVATQDIPRLREEMAAWRAAAQSP